MATEIICAVQSVSEIRTYFADFTNDLPTGVTVASATATHTPPSGTAVNPTVGTIASNIAPITVPALTVVGTHIVSVVATLNSGDKSEIRLLIPVQWTAARATMSDLLQDLRAMTDASSNDYTVAGQPYWTDIQLQNILDQRRISMKFTQLDVIPDYSGGSYTYTEYRIPLRNVEGGTASMRVMDAGGVEIAAAGYTFDRARSVIVFTTDQAAASRFITANSYNLEMAAADVWKRKASHYATAYDISTDNHSLKRSQLVAQCREQARYYESMGGASSVTMERGDC